jgi:hypothetical protein
MSTYNEVMTCGPTTFAMSLMATANNVTLNSNPLQSSIFLFLWVKKITTTTNTEMAIPEETGQKQRYTTP